MGTVQLNTKRIIDYRKDINYGRFLNLENDTIFFEGKKLISLSDYNSSASDFLNNSRFNHMYAHYGLLEHLFLVNIIKRNMDFKSFKSAYISEFLKQQHPWMEAHRVVINRMVNATKYKFKYFNYYDDKVRDRITRSIASGLPVILNCVFDIEGSNMFYNSLLVSGIIKDTNGLICGVICHDYAGDANSNYVNKNGSRVVYTGNVFYNFIRTDRIGVKNEVSVGIVVEEDI